MYTLPVLPCKLCVTATAQKRECKCSQVNTAKKLAAGLEKGKASKGVCSDYTVCSIICCVHSVIHCLKRRL